MLTMFLILLTWLKMIHYLIMEWNLFCIHCLKTQGLNHKICYHKDKSNASIQVGIVMVRMLNISKTRYKDKVVLNITIH